MKASQQLANYHFFLVCNWGRHGLPQKPRYADVKKNPKASCFGPACLRTNGGHDAVDSAVAVVVEKEVNFWSYAV